MVKYLIYPIIKCSLDQVPISQQDRSEKKTFIRIEADESGNQEYLQVLWECSKQRCHWIKIAKHWNNVDIDNSSANKPNAKTAKISNNPIKTRPR